MEVPAQPRFVIFDKESWSSGLFCLLNTNFFLLTASYHLHHGQTVSINKLNK